MGIVFHTKPKKDFEKLEIVKIPIDSSAICLRGLSPRRLRFELEYALERGSTDNCFLFTSPLDSRSNGQVVVLVHPPGDIYGEVFLPALAETLPQKISRMHVIIGHVNPNRVSFLKKLVEAYPFLEIISSNPGVKLLKELWVQKKPQGAGNEINTEQLSLPPLPHINVIKHEQRFIQFEDRDLHLLPASTPRWPGGLLVFDETSGILMSDKFFSAHICTANWCESNGVSTEEDRRYFYDSLMASMSTQVESILDRFEDLDIRTIAPGHGPAIETSWRSLVSNYRRWGEGQRHASLKVLLLFASAYGNTAAMADALSRGVSRTGVRVDIYNCEFTSAEELLEAVREADAYLIGSPTLGGHAPTPIVSALGTLLAEGDRKKKVGVFGSYGWSGEALDLLEHKLRDGGFSFAFDPIKVKFSPNTTMIKMLEETGTHFGRELIVAHRRKTRRVSGGLTTSRSDPSVLALGRVIGSLCVLTTRQGSGDKALTGAMVASWVSQASFSPPGITVSVAKDRAVESLLHIGDSFALNILAEGRENKTMKQFLQPFAAGADRFQGLELEISPAGQPLLSDSVAWLEATVQYRMECGDHWLIYADVKHGKVNDAEVLTAVHHRKTGANY